MNKERRSVLLRDFARKIAYMFYEGQEVMVMEGILHGTDRELTQEKEIKGKTIDELQNIIHLKKKLVEDSLGILRRDGIISSNETIDMEGWDPNKKMGEREKKNRTRVYYAIDWKTFCDSVRIKIKLSQRALEEKCGKEDNVFYQCKNESCGIKIPLVELLKNGDFYGALTCPLCGSEVEKLKIDDEVNRNKKELADFIQLTDPLLTELERYVNDCVFEDKWEYRVDATAMMTSKEYKVKQTRMKDYDEGRDFNKYGTQTTTSEVSTKIDVQINEKKELTHASEDVVNILKESETNKNDDQEVTISTGQVFKLKEITMEFLDNWKGTDDDLNTLYDFYEKYKI